MESMDNQHVSIVTGGRGGEGKTRHGLRAHSPGNCIGGGGGGGHSRQTVGAQWPAGKNEVRIF